jgi:hypothetical protein
MTLRTSRSAPHSHERFATSLLDELARRDPDGSRLQASAADAVALVADQVLATAALWEEQLGAFYDTDGVRQLLARGGEPVSRQAVHKRRGLLALRTGSGQTVYPAFQFRGRALAPGLDRVLDLLPSDLVSGWTVASWLVSPEAELEGEHPVEVLFTGPDAAVDRVVTAAAHWAARLAA